jgi:hypothetical protein
VAQCENFELLVKSNNTEEASPTWLTVVLDENGAIKLRKARKHKKPPVYVLKLIDCMEKQLGIWVTLIQGNKNSNF